LAPAERESVPSERPEKPATPAARTAPVEPKPEPKPEPKLEPKLEAQPPPEPAPKPPVAKGRPTRDPAKPASATDPLEHETFFADGERADREHREARARAAQGRVEPEPEHEVDPRERIKMTPAVRERRARFTRYVTWAVGASAVVCLAAFVRVVVARGHHEVDATHAASMQLAVPAPQPVAQVIAATVVEAPPPTEPTAPVASPVAPAVEPPAPAASAAADAPTPTELDPVAAKVEKKAAQSALDRGDMKGAIEAGERSVALDPTDGDTWLVLGAAYQERGKAADARRCFIACTKQGKRGAIGECAAMLR
jgi:hypothetical protein